MYTPIFFKKKINWNYFNLKPKKLKSRIAKWSYLNFKRFSFPWLQKKKNFPKVVRHLKTEFSFLKKNSQYDPMTGYIFLLTDLYKFSLTFDQVFKSNYLIKLHNYRYNAN
jgi:hypothetical protein